MQYDKLETMFFFSAHDFKSREILFVFIEKSTQISIT